MQKMPPDLNSESSNSRRAKPETDGTEPVWTFRGYRLKPGEFTTAMVHFYRAEVQRANVWRQRLDTTTNWAVISTGAVITFAFTETMGHHALVLLSFMLVMTFLLIEARRYRYYELWSYRVRLMETEFFANMLVPPFSPSPEWAARLSEALIQPEFPISMLEAFGRRLRRNYLAIFTILLMAWMGKLWLYPTPPVNSQEMISRATVGGLSGELVWGGMLIFYVSMILVALWTIQLHQASGEVFPWTRKHDIQYIRVAGQGDQKKEWIPIRRPRPQVMALVITDMPQDVADEIMNEMKRGVTALQGKGMYSGNAHHVLLCALGMTEINRLKQLVARTDQKAFVIVLAAHEVLGRGFVPLSSAPS
jgi:uncharacterized membrane protein